MSEPTPSYAECAVLVARVTHSHVSGDGVADGLRDQLAELVERSGARHLVLDMAAVTYLSSAGIRPLLALNKKARDRGGRLALCRLSETVEEVLLATRLISSAGSAPATFERFADVPAAVASLYQ